LANAIICGIKKYATTKLKIKNRIAVIGAKIRENKKIKQNKENSVFLPYIGNLVEHIFK
jgi:hypothetical protein